MRCSYALQVILVVAGVGNAQFAGGTYTAVVGGPDTNASLFGNYYNYWVKTSSGLWDLTRSAREPVTTAKTIPCTGRRNSIIIEPSRSALVIIDMDNYFLHPGLSPQATAGRAIVNATIDMIHGFRKAGMKVLWTNWGFDNSDVLTTPPTVLDGFSVNDSPATSLGSDMGIVPGTNIAAGPKLMRGSWNAQPWGPLYDLQVEGVAKGTDLYFNKNRQSGLWGAQTPLGLWLQENEITTLFFGGVNADQCVWGTLLDACNKGYDVIYVDDISATTSPYYAIEMVRYNANSRGFLSNSTLILPALKSNSKSES